MVPLYAFLHLHDFLKRDTYSAQSAALAIRVRHKGN